MHGRGRHRRGPDPRGARGPASTARSTVAVSVIPASWGTRRSLSRARASSTFRTGRESCSMRVPSRSSTRPGTGTSSPIFGSSRPTSIRPSSSRNSGFPRLVSWSWRTTLIGRLRPSRSNRIRRAAPRLTGPTSSRSIPAGSSARSRSVGSPVRLASRKRTACPSSLRAAYPSASAEGRSSQGMSSTATSSGSCSASARRVLRSPAETANGSAGSPSASERSSAVSRARRCGAGTAARSSRSTASSRSASAPNESPVSASLGRAARTRNPCRRPSSVPDSHSVVLPAPGSPVRTNAARDSVSRKCASVASSGSRPTTSAPARVTVCSMYRPLRVG